MDPLHLAIAFTPLASYLIALGAIHVRSRPTVWSGTLDTTILAAAVAGLVVAGPMDLFLPEASPLSGLFLWMLMLALYVLGITLWNLLARQRVVIFNITVERLHEVLTGLAPRLDEQTVVVAESYLLPQLGVHFQIERYVPMHNISLVAIGDQQAYSGWRRLQTELNRALAPVACASRVPGYSFLVVGVFIVVSTAMLLGKMGRPAIEQEWLELLRMPPAAETHPVDAPQQSDAPQQPDAPQHAGSGGA